jgi:CRISPR system Cascade subunit CasD
MTADGRGKKENTIVSYRQYLQDASFLAAVHAEDSILDECIYALKHPVWTPYLGRKSCVPTKPIFAGETTCYDTLEQALRQVPRTERSDLVNRIIWESENGTVIRQDTPIDAQKRVFGWSRYEDGSVITEGKVNV